jgi:hypothetical protein
MILGRQVGVPNPGEYRFTGRLCNRELNKALGFLLHGFPNDRFREGTSWPHCTWFAC